MLRPLVLGHVERDLVSLVDVPLIVDVSEGVGNEEELSAAFVDDPPHPWVRVRLAGLEQQANKNVKCRGNRTTSALALYCSFMGFYCCA